MPKNLKGGNKAKSQKNSTKPTKDRDIPVPLEEDDSHVAIITKILGDGRFYCQIINENGIQKDEYITNLSRGVKNKYTRGIQLGPGTYILISIREYQKSKTDILFAYNDAEISYLKNNNIITTDKINSDKYDDIEFSEFIDKAESNEPSVEIKEI